MTARSMVSRAPPCLLRSSSSPVDSPEHPFGVRVTDVGETTRVTPRILRGAHQCSKIHERLVEGPALPLRDHTSTETPEAPLAVRRCRRGALDKDPGEEALDVRVQGGAVDVEGKTQQGPRRGATHSGEGAHLPDGFRKVASVAAG